MNWRRSTGRAPLRCPSGFGPGVVVVVGTAGLLAFALWSFSNSAESQRGFAEDASRRATQAVARNLLVLVDTPEFFQAFADEERFDVVEGNVVVPESIHHLGPGRTDSPEHTLPPPARFLVREARKAEFREGDLLGASALLVRAGAHPSLDRGHREWILLQRAYLADRANDPQTRDHLTRELLSAVAGGDGEGPASAAVTVGLASLAYRVEGSLPPWLAAHFSTLPGSLAESLVERLESIAPSDPEVLGLRDRWERLRRHRRTLSIARNWTRSFEALASHEETFHDQLLFFRAADGQTGEGVVAGFPRWTSILSRTVAADLTGNAWLTGISARDAVRVNDAVSVLPGIALRRRAANIDRALDRAILGAALFGLAVLTVLGVASWLRAARREEQALQARVEFITAVTHELKTPLASISLHAEMLEDDRASAQQRARYVRSLAADTQRMTLLVENVLGVDPVERGTRAYDPRPERIAPLVAEAAERYRPIAEREDLVIEVTLADPDTTVEVDRAALLHVLLNLFENVRRYALVGGSVHVQGTRQVDRHRETDRYRLDIRDRGPGVAAADRERIFGKFERGRTPTLAANPGVGLGLYLCRAIMRDLGGTITCVDPDDGGPGATFRLELPARRAGEVT